MTREEAIEILRDTPIDIRSPREDDIFTMYATAQGMAIEALSADRPKAEWKTDADGCWCSNCESYFFNDEDGEYVREYDYCPDCGASMKRPF